MRVKKFLYFMLYIAAFFIIYESGTPPSIISIHEMYIDKLLLFISIGIIDVLAFKRKANFIGLFYWSALFLFFSVLNSFVCFETTFQLLYRLYILLSIYFVISFADDYNIDFDKILCTVIIAISYASLIIYILVHLLSLPLPYHYFYLGENGIRYISYGGLYYEQGYRNLQFGISLYRMTGPFWEPGVYQLFLNYALYRCLIIENRKNHTSIILLLNLFLSMSTSGWVCALGIIGFKVVSSERIRNNKVIIRIFFLTFVLLVSGIIVVSKFVETYANKSSAFVRVNDFSLAFKLFCENPLGVGFNNTTQFIERNDFNNTSYLGSSNGLMTIVYTTGIVGILFIIYPFLVTISKKRNDKGKEVFYFLMILFFNFVEPVYYFPFMLYILAKEYYSIRKEKGRKIECLAI